MLGVIGSLVLALAVFPVPGAGAQVPDAVASIPNYVLIRPGVAAGGQPTTEGLARLKELGFRTVINLRSDAEKGFVDERAAIEAQGLRYVSVPITPATFSQGDADAVRAVLDDPAAGPVLIHCASANRVGAVWAVIEGRAGRSLPDAEAEGRRVGLASEGMVAAVRRVLDANR